MNLFEQYLEILLKVYSIVTLIIYLLILIEAINQKQMPKLDCDFKHRIIFSVWILSIIIWFL